MSAIKRYGRWISIPLLAAAALLWLQAGQPAPSQSGLVPRDPKLRRTLRLFDMAAVAKDGSPEATQRLDHDGMALDITMDPMRFKLMEVRDNRIGFKTRTTDVALSFEGGPDKPATVVLRGSGTLKPGSKLNFHVTMLRREELAPNLRFKHFYLVAMVEDPYEISTLFGYRVMEDLGVFLCHHQYVRVSINGEPQGMYLLVEPPTRAIRRQFPDVVAIHRRHKVNIIETYWTNGRYNATSSLDDLLSLNVEDRVEDVVAQYSRVLDLDSYLTWTACNSVLMNADHLDELYLYERRREGAEMDPAPLAVMGWDFDNLVYPPKRGALADPLLYSCFDRIDEVIQSRPELYQMYRRKLAQLLRDRLTADYLKDTLESVLQLRDRLDDGLPADVQAKRQQERDAKADQMQKALLARHAELLERLSKDTAVAP